MKDHEKRNLITDLCATAVQFHATEQLRDRVARLVLDALDRERAAERERWAAPLRSYIAAVDVVWHETCGLAAVAGISHVPCSEKQAEAIGKFQALREMLEGPNGKLNGGQPGPSV